MDANNIQLQHLRIAAIRLVQIIHYANTFSPNAQPDRVKAFGLMNLPMKKKVEEEEEEEEEEKCLSIYL
jgi:hypothetical protein